MRNDWLAESRRAWSKLDGPTAHLERLIAPSNALLMFFLMCALLPRPRRP